MDKRERQRLFPFFCMFMNIPSMCVVNFSKFVGYTRISVKRYIMEELDYNTQREKLHMPEYGRHVQKMVEYVAKLSLVGVGYGESMSILKSDIT